MTREERIDFEERYGKAIDMAREKFLEANPHVDRNTTFRITEIEANPAILDKFQKCYNFPVNLIDNKEMPDNRIAIALTKDKRKQRIVARLERDGNARRLYEYRQNKTRGTAYIAGNDDEDSYLCTLKSKSIIFPPSKHAQPSTWVEFEEMVRTETWDFLGDDHRKGLDIFKRVFMDDASVKEASTMEGLAEAKGARLLGEFCKTMDELLPPEVMAGLPRNLRAALQCKKEERRLDPPPSKNTYIGAVSPAAVSDEQFAEAVNLVRGSINYLKRKFFVRGWDRDDIEQECLLAINEGLRLHDPNRGALKPFLCLVMRRRIISALKASQMLSRDEKTTGSLQWPLYNNKPLSSILPIPETHFEMDSDRLWSSLCAFSSLTKMEAKVMRARATGATYEQAAKKCRKIPKAVDNALHRAKRKLRLAWALHSSIPGAKHLAGDVVGRPRVPAWKKR